MPLFSNEYEPDNTYGGELTEYAAQLVKEINGKEIMLMNIKSKVMTMANALVKQGVSRSAAMVRAWITVKLRAIQTRAAGVTHGNRQTLLNHLTRYKPEDITVTLRRERNNAHDRNAIQIVAAVRSKGAAVIGYTNRELAAAPNIRAAAHFILVRYYRVLLFHLLHG